MTKAQRVEETRGCTRRVRCTGELDGAPASAGSRAATVPAVSVKAAPADIWIRAALTPSSPAAEAGPREASKRDTIMCMALELRIAT